MILSIVVTVCHMALTEPPDNSLMIVPDRMTPAGYVDLCHEDILAEEDMPMQTCMLSEPQIAYWKEHSVYAAAGWTVKKWRCIPGHYVVKDAI